MGKATHATKETKKQPVMTTKEKKAAKQAKKQGAQAVHPLLTR